MKFPKASVIQFAKEPVAGRVKTRLEPVLGKEGALELHCTLTQRIFHRCYNPELCSYEVWVGGDCQHPFFEEMTSQSGCPVKPQSGGDLGQRMSNALHQTLEEMEYVVIIGSDCPVMDTAYLEQAFRMMANGADVVIGPAEDGGYVLIGMKSFKPSLFENISWGSDNVLHETRKQLQALPCRSVELPALWDVDWPEDLVRFRKLTASG